jgi:oligopeptide/dipeptide ABC transporter ATP-binding protein
MTAPLLQLCGLRVSFGDAQPVAGMDLDVQPGEILGIVGESGSGKSLMLRAILRLLPPDARLDGQVLWQGQDMAALTGAALREVRGRGIAMVFQEPMTALNPVLTIGLQITESLSEHLGLRGAAARRRAAELLDLVGIPSASRRLGSYPHEFSGGMRQRAMIAIALAAGPKLLLADEPTTVLDVTIQDQILRLLLRLQRELSMAVVIVTHDLGVVAGTCDRMAVMYAGTVLETGPTAKVFARPAHAYTLGLLNSLPDAARARQHLPGIPGTPPDLLALPPGCRFAPRCGFAVPACNAALPSLAPHGPGRWTACIRPEAVGAAAVARAA